MATDTLANNHRPKMFKDVVGQTEEIKVLKQIVAGSWQPNAVMLTGPFGTGKTTLARLLTRAMHCTDKQEDEDGLKCEPCGLCDPCKSMDEDNNPQYVEVDAASQGSVNDVRGMKDLLSYRTGNVRRVVCYDESHMLSPAAQNALLQTLEEGSDSVLYIFCTTESAKMLPTVQSRCIVLNMKLLSPPQIWKRLEEIAAIEGIGYEPKAFRIVASYVRGHARDALVMLEQLSRMTDNITEAITRTYLRLDKNDEVYKFLTAGDKSEGLQALETLLCNFAPSQLTQTIGTILVNAYKLANGTGDFTEVDKAWLKKVIEHRGRDTLLDEAEAVMQLDVNFATINLGIASIGRILIESKTTSTKAKPGLRPGGAPAATALPTGRRKPGT